MRIDLRKEPYALSEEDIRWVNDTIASTALEEKIGQLFVRSELLLKKKAEGTLVPPAEATKVLACEQHLKWAEEVTEII